MVDVVAVSFSVSSSFFGSFLLVVLVVFEPGAVWSRLGRRGGGTSGSIRLRLLLRGPAIAMQLVHPKFNRIHVVLLLSIIKCFHTRNGGWYEVSPRLIPPIITESRCCCCSCCSTPSRLRVASLRRKRGGGQTLFSGWLWVYYLELSPLPWCRKRNAFESTLESIDYFMFSCDPYTLSYTNCWGLSSAHLLSLLSENTSMLQWMISSALG